MGDATLRGLSAKQAGLIVSVLALYFFAPTQSIISSVLGNIGMSYPDVGADTLSYLITLNNIAAVPAAFVFGVLAGRKVRFKTISIVAMLCFIVGGGLPVFLPQDSPFWILMASRAVIGFGRGCFIPIVQIILSSMFTEEKTRAAWFGIGSVFFNIGATFGTAIAGFLAIVDWRFCFAFYLFAFIPLGLFGIFFKEEGVKDYIATQEKGYLRFPSVCWVYFLLYALSIVMSQTMFNYASITMEPLGVDSVNVGLALSCFTISAAVVGATFTFIYRFFRHFIFALGVGIMTAGFVIIYTASLGVPGHVALLYLASVVIGAGCSIVTVGCPLSMSLFVVPSAVAATLSFNEVFHNGGSFLSSPYSQIVFSIAGPDASTNVIFLATALYGLILTTVAIAVGLYLRRRGMLLDPSDKEGAVTCVDEPERAGMRHGSEAGGMNQSAFP